jgi:hypothetical protein
MIKTLPIPPWFHSTNTFLFLVLSPTLQSSRFQQLLERLDQAILDVINNPKRAQKTARIGTLI